MPSKSHRKPARKPRRSPDGRFQGQPRTISETSMPDEYAPGAEAPREVRSDTRQTATVAAETDTSKRTVKAESTSRYFFVPPYIVPVRARYVRPWYRRLWSTVLEWLR